MTLADELREQAGQLFLLPGRLFILVGKLIVQIFYMTIGIILKKKKKKLFIVISMQFAP